MSASQHHRVAVLRERLLDSIIEAVHSVPQREQRTIVGSERLCELERGALRDVGTGEAEPVAELDRLDLVYVADEQLSSTGWSMRCSPTKYRFSRAVPRQTADLLQTRKNAKSCCLGHGTGSLASDRRLLSPLTVHRPACSAHAPSPPDTSSNAGHRPGWEFTAHPQIRTRAPATGETVVVCCHAPDSVAHRR